MEFLVRPAGQAAGPPGGATAMLVGFVVAVAVVTTGVLVARQSEREKLVAASAGRRRLSKTEAARRAAQRRAPRARRAPRVGPKSGRASHARVRAATPAAAAGA